MIDFSENKTEYQTIKLFRFIGYTFLLLSLFDIFSILFPPKLMNPEWEIQAITALVERVAAPLVGMALVFYKDSQIRLKWEFLALKILSWAALSVGILYFLLLPLLVMNNVRLDAMLSSQLNTRIDQQSVQADRLVQRVTKASSKAELNALLGGQALVPDFQTKSVQEIKQELLDKITQGKPNIRKQAEASVTERRFNQLKLTVKIFLGAVVSGFSFIYIWSLTRWCRVFHLSPPPKKAVIGDTLES